MTMTMTNDDDIGEASTGVWGGSGSEALEVLLLERTDFTCKGFRVLSV